MCEFHDEIESVSLEELTASTRADEGYSRKYDLTNSSSKDGRHKEEKHCVQVISVQGHRAQKATPELIKFSEPFDEAHRPCDLVPMFLWLPCKYKGGVWF